MANTISTYCKEYVNNQMETLRMFNTYALTQDLNKQLVSHRGKYVSYDQVTLGTGGMGTFSRATGYTNKDITVTHVDKELTKDKGNSLYIDAMDATEAQVEGSIVRLYNQYVQQVAIPTIDADTLAVLGAHNTATEVVHASVSASNIIGFLLSDKAKLEQGRVKFNECIIYIASSKKALLDEASLGKGYLSLGAWNGDMTAQVELFYGAKVISVPDATLGSGVSWIIVHPLACDKFVVYQEAVFFEEVAGYGARRKQVDVGFYYDTFIRPDGLSGIVVSVPTARS